MTDIACTICGSKNAVLKKLHNGYICENCIDYIKNASQESLKKEKSAHTSNQSLCCRNPIN